MNSRFEKKLNVMFETKQDVITNMRKVHDGLSYRFLNSCYLTCNVENMKKLQHTSLLIHGLFNYDSVTMPGLTPTHNSQLFGKKIDTKMSCCKHIEQGHIWVKKKNLQLHVCLVMLQTNEITYKCQSNRLNNTSYCFQQQVRRRK